MFKWLDGEGRIVPVLATPTQILKARPDRKALHIWPVGALVVFLLPHSNVAENKGIPLEGDDWPIVYRFSRDPELTTYSWWAVAPNGDTDLLVMEIY